MLAWASPRELGFACGNSAKSPFFNLVGRDRPIDGRNWPRLNRAFSANEFWDRKPEALPQAAIERRAFTAKHAHTSVAPPRRQFSVYFATAIDRRYSKKNAERTTCLRRCHASLDAQIA